MKVDETNYGFRDNDSVNTLWRVPNPKSHSNRSIYRSVLGPLPLVLLNVCIVRAHLDRFDQFRA